MLYAKNSVVFAAALVALSYGCASQTLRHSDYNWHTTPDRWAEPRIFHTTIDPEFASHITISHAPLAQRPVEQVVSPNDAYSLWLVTFRSTNQLDQTTSVYVFTERDYLLKVELNEHDPRYESTVKWVNEKVVFVRVWWGRVVGTDLMIDVEREKIVYEEMIEDGGIPFQQWHALDGMFKHTTPFWSDHDNSLWLNWFHKNPASKHPYGSFFDGQK